MNPTAEKQRRTGLESIMYLVAKGFNTTAPLISAFETQEAAIKFFEELQGESETAERRTPAQPMISEGELQKAGMKIRLRLPPSQRQATRSVRRSPRVVRMATRGRAPRGGQLRFPPPGPRRRRAAFGGANEGGNDMTQTPAQLKAAAAYYARRKADGFKRVTFLLGPEAQAGLERAKAIHGSSDKAGNAVLAAFGKD